MRPIFVAGALILVLFVAGAPSAGAVLHISSTLQQAGPDGGEARLVFVGDLMMGRYVNSSMLRGGFDAPFKDIAPYISSADLAIGNLEGPIVPPGAIPIPSGLAQPAEPHGQQEGRPRPCSRRLRPSVPGQQSRLRRWSRGHRIYRGSSAPGGHRPYGPGLG